MKVKNITLCLGPICSGKTTWSLNYTQETHTPRLSLDEMRMMMTGELSDDIDDGFKRIFHATVVSIAFTYGSIVIDGLFLDMHYIKLLCDMTDNLVIRLFDVTQIEAVTRNCVRNKTQGIWIDPSEMKEYTEVYEEFINSTEFIKILDSPGVTVMIDSVSTSNAKLVHNLSM